MGWVGMGWVPAWPFASEANSPSFTSALVGLGVCLDLLALARPPLRPASARFSDYLPLPRDVRAAILDGAGAIKHVAEVEAPVVICILDRSVADEQ